ncbi:hypothetical protein B0J12DRAFT_674734 [Macrophomina phaseolina]|uniref:Acyltransferase 3 domain-containing protein n=1 Tax=Macrophomina phaseolina TaxID=35725 RepID=A0ABQ8G1H1_9PEZI|nr:hypothetical protein B0J12DRAFT_674734 [Macrophomina phaseolina]
MPPVFFVISGYCACHSAMRLRDAQGPPAMVNRLSRSAFRRGLRLYLPVFFMATLSQLLFFFGLYNWNWTEVTLQPWHAPLAHLKYLVTYLFEIANPMDVTQNPGLNLQYWVIPVEYAGSLTVYTTCLALAGAKRTVRPILLALLILPFIYRGSFLTYTFLAGHLIAELDLVRAHGTGSQRRGLSHRATTALLLASLYFLSLPDNYPATPGYAFLDALTPPRWGAVAQHNWRALAACLFVYALSSDVRLQALPSATLPQYLGSISWEVYLCHMMVYRLWRSPLMDFVMSRFEYATTRGLGWGVVVSGVVAATAVQGCASGLKRVNAWLMRCARLWEGWALEAAEGA